jgi:MoaA/NifB/PqqE/SkfB family radical SAM enzyme
MLRTPAAATQEIDMTAAPKRMTRVITTFTTRCNLRCAYCPEGSHPESFYGDMKPELLEEIINYAKSHSIRVDVSFYGESMFHPRFAEYATKILDAGIRLDITSNLARLLTDEEIAIVARCGTMSFSFDTVDPEAAKAIRKGLDLRTLTFNILRIRAYCVRTGTPVPSFILKAVLTDQTANGLPSLIAFASSMGLDTVCLNELATMEGTLGTLVNVAALRGEALRAALDSIDEAKALAERLGIRLYCSGQEPARLIDAASRVSEETIVPETRKGIAADFYYVGSDRALDLKPGSTRLCHEPWVSPLIDPKGVVYPCCSRGTVMGVVGAGVSLADVHSNEAFRSLRRSLLTGENLDDDCRRCSLAPEGTPEKLQSQVSRLFA